MMETRDAALREMDLSRPAAARIYDSFLGGCHNFGVDRELAERLETDLPGIADSYQENRAFLRRAVEFMLAHDIRQFLDLGSGIPTIGQVHEVARRRTRDFRVVYVDNEPLTVAHSRPLLTREPNAAIIHADIRDPASVLRASQVRQLLDLSEPVGLLMSAVLHFVPDSDRPAELVEAYRDAVVPGSHLLIAHLTDSYDPAAMRTLADFYAESADPLHARSTSAIEKFLGDFEPIPPGPGLVATWRPEPGPRPAPRYEINYGAMTRKR
ncbi:SAM-dependent methyltransferase [Saccharopolyspora halophila]|uniref:SAM-dependent methyltransferase n=1 Tax=Saccharopolyspora halophila TaxID=405551 RepID=A0ABN3FZP8_9PSEU